MCLILYSTASGFPGDTEAGNHHADRELFLLEVLQNFGAAEGVGGPVGQVLWARWSCGPGPVLGGLANVKESSARI